MTIAIEITPIPGVLIVQTRRFNDARGFFTQTYSKRDLAEFGVGVDFVQDNLSFNRERGTLRGLHYQREPAAQAKLVSVVKGSVLDVVVDLRRGSPCFGQHLSIELNATNGTELFIPVGFAHGFITREAETLFTYKVSHAYSPQDECGIRFDDASLAIDWAAHPDAIITSAKDRSWPPFDPSAEYFQ